MSIVQARQIISVNLQETLKLADEIGHKLQGGETIELISDLGGGKTTFVRGLARGMGSKDNVRSPSFTLENRYHSDGLTIHHFDFYRLNEPGIMRNEIAEFLADPRAIIVVEWGMIVEDVLPAKRLSITIRATGDKNREMTFMYPKSLDYLIPKHLAC